MHDLETTRGDLFICDVFRHDPAFGGAPFIAQHDFRIAPMARAHDQTATLVNPLINEGITTNGAGPIVMRNDLEIWGLEIWCAPGNAADGPARFDAWDFDCEGFGNPRISDRRSGYSSTPAFIGPGVPDPTCGALIDIGADECGELIVSGYVDSTRIFSRNDSTHVAIASHATSINTRDRLVFFNCFSDTSNFFIRPQFNALLDRARTTPSGGSSAWYAQNTPATNPYDPIGTSNYTTGLHDATATPPPTRHSLVTIPSIPQGQTDPLTPLYPRFMRNLICDISPHLHFDHFPWSNPDARAFSYAVDDTFAHPDPAVASGIPDAFDPNPWYHSQDPTMAAFNDNFRLYTSSNGIQPVLGTLNPPATTTADPSSSIPAESFLFRSTSLPIFLWDFTPSQSGLYSVGQRGWGELNTPLGELVPHVSGHDWQGIRVNLELFAPEASAWNPYGNPTNNLQTLLIVQGASGGSPEIPLESSAQATSGQGTTTCSECTPGTPTYTLTIDTMRGLTR